MPYFIVVFELAKGLVFPLDGVVREMNENVVGVLKIVLIRRSPNVAVLVPVALQRSVHSREKDVAPDVEFAVVDSNLRPKLQEAFLEVFLEDNGFLGILVCKPILHFLQDRRFVLQHCDPIPPITAFFLANPDVP